MEKLHSQVCAVNIDAPDLDVESLNYGVDTHFTVCCTRFNSLAAMEKTST